MAGRLGPPSGLDLASVPLASHAGFQVKRCVVWHPSKRMVGHWAGSWGFGFQFGSPSPCAVPLSVTSRPRNTLRQWHPGVTKLVPEFRPEEPTPWMLKAAVCVRQMGAQGSLREAAPRRPLRCLPWRNTGLGCQLSLCFPRSQKSRSLCEIGRFLYADQTRLLR